MAKQNAEHTPAAAFNDEVLTTASAARFVLLSERTLEGYRVKGGGPPFIKATRKSIRYFKSDLVRWLESNRRVSTSDGAGVASSEVEAAR
jgi:Helix-turn-helix domain